MIKILFFLLLLAPFKSFPSSNTLQLYKSKLPNLNKGIEVQVKNGAEIKSVKFLEEKEMNGLYPLLRMLLYSNWNDNFSGYNEEKISDNIYRLTDMSSLKSVHEYILYFKANKLIKIIEKSAIGTTTIQVKYLRRKSKNYISQIESKTFHGRQVRQSEIKIKYSIFNKKLLPVSINKRSFYKVLASGDHKALQKVESEKLEFLNYKTL